MADICLWHLQLVPSVADSGSFLLKPVIKSFFTIFDSIFDELFINSHPFPNPLTVHSLQMLFHLVFPAVEAATFALSPSWVPGTRAAILWTEVLDFS